MIMSVMTDKCYDNEGNGSNDTVQIKPAVQFFSVPRWMAAHEN